jgi:hypothetical protein
MDLEFRDTQITDVDALFEVRANTRQNPASADPTVRAHGFYRALGWRPTGERTANGDEILELVVQGQ